MTAPTNAINPRSGKRFIREALHEAQAEVIDRGWLDGLPLSDKQRARYRAERAHATGRNLGPATGRRVKVVKALWVAVDVDLQPGCLVNGVPIVAVAKLRSQPVGPRLHSERQAKKALARICRTRPWAFITWVTYRADRPILSPVRWETAPVFEGEEQK